MEKGAAAHSVYDLPDQNPFHAAWRVGESREGKLYNIEIRQRGELELSRGIRYNGTMIDVEFLAKGSEYKAMPDRVHFYIREKDI